MHHVLGGVVIVSSLPHRHCSGELLVLYYFVGEEEGCELTFHELSVRVTVKRVGKIPVVRPITFICSSYERWLLIHINIRVHMSDVLCEKLHTP